MSLADYQQLVDDLVRDRDQVIDVGQRDDAIAGAVMRYSLDAPAPLIADVLSVNGGQRLPVPAGWVAHSQLRSLEHPVGQTPPSFIGLNGVSLYHGLTGPEIVLLVSLLANDVVRVSYTGAHVLDAHNDSIPLHHRRAVACLAAADVCGQLSAWYATEGAPTLQADTVDHQGKTERYRTRARDLAAEYTRIVGPAPTERKRPAMAEAAFESRDSLGRRTLFHPPRNWPQ